MKELLRKTVKYFLKHNLTTIIIIKPWLHANIICKIICKIIANIFQLNIGFFEVFVIFDFELCSILACNKAFIINKIYTG